MMEIPSRREETGQVMNGDTSGRKELSEEQLPEGPMTPSGIKLLKDHGWNQQQIGKHFGVSRQAVSKMSDVYDIPWETKRRQALKMFPCKVVSAQQRCAPFMRVRDYMVSVFAPGELSEDGEKRVEWFIRKLTDENVIVVFDPSIPPKPGISPAGGWDYCPREASDGDLIIRANEHTVITPLNRPLLTLPK
ncbi:hypothetical protein [Kitasatospora sp. NPDC056184]|uniref:hypothetical protein n=1 Tax=Kitasatospora sp. NPDC056184 TaxID=3345738 RepID=UPI0035E277D3